MKRYLFLALMILSSRLLVAQSTKGEPLYFYLYATISDQVNADISEDRLRRLLPMIERFRKEHPEAHVSAAVLFSGAMSQVLEQRNAKTHIKDYVLSYKKRGVIEIGYDGTDEPTYEKRPLASFGDDSTAEGRWLTRVNADQRFLTEARDPLTGTPVPNGVGGLLEMQRVFGEASCIRGASVSGAVMASTTTMGEKGDGPPPRTLKIRPEVGDWEVVPLLRHYSPNAVLFGYPEANLANLPGFKGSVLVVGNLMSPVADSSPEFYWADNVLRIAEWAGGGVPVTRVMHANEGVEALTTAAGKVERTRIHILHMEVASESNYLTPEFAKTWTAPGPRSMALSYAYSHADKPGLPADARLNSSDVDAAYAREAATLKWLTEQYLPANAGSRFVSNEDLKQMTPPSTGYSVSVAALQKALKGMLDAWGNDTFLPPYLQVEGHYLSLADLFGVMTDSLAELNRTGKLPEKVKVSKVYGPIEMPVGHGPNAGELSVAAIAKEASELLPRLHDDTADPMPKNTVPPGVVVDGKGVNSAQFLRLMAHAMVDPDPSASLKIRMTYMFSSTAEVMPKSRPLSDVGSSWTFKPAPLDTHLGTNQALR